MTIDTTTPRTRRAMILGALGGALASAVAMVRPPASRADTGDNLVLGQSNGADAQTELLTTAPGVGLRVVGGDVAIQGWGASFGVDAYGSTIGVNAISDGAGGPGVVAYNRGDGVGVFGWTTDGNQSPPSMPAKRGVYGLSADGVGVSGVSTDGVGVRGESTNGPGVIGVGPLGFIPETIDFNAGVYGAAATDGGVYGHGESGPGVFGRSNTGDGIYGDTIASGSHLAHSTGAGVHGHGGLAGLYGTGDSSFGVLAVSNSVPAIVARNNSATAAAIVADGEPGTAIHGHANAGGGTVDNLMLINLPPSPALTGIYGSAFLTGTAIAADSETGLALRATSSAGNAIRGHGQFDGVIGESGGDNSGVVSFSGAGTAPRGPLKTGVYGEASQDAAARGVHGKSVAGQGVRGEATTGVGVQAVATTGVALAVSGRLTLSRSGKITIPVGLTIIDVGVGGGLSSNAIVFATLQYSQPGVWVTGARPNWPSAGKIRIYLNKALASPTPVAWMVVG